MANEREASADRLIVLSDGVVAIAITLLILPLTEIEPAEGSNLADVVVQNQGALFAFAQPLSATAPP